MRLSDLEIGDCFVFINSKLCTWIVLDKSEVAVVMQSKYGTTWLDLSDREVTKISEIEFVGL